jgi:nucleotidyltransferase/DNA polymerase involved in DNA repair
VAEVDPEELAKVLEIEKEKAMEIVAGAIQASQKEDGTGVDKEGPLATGDLALDPVDRMGGVGEKTAQILEANGLKTIRDILEANVEKLSGLQGIGIKKAEKLIESAKQYTEGKRT